MDPFAAATAQIIGLLVQFLQERRGQTSATIAEYQEWLRRKEHAQVLEELQRNRGLVTAINELLTAGHVEIADRLHRMNTVLSQVLKHVEGWDQIIREIGDSSDLPEQCVSILQQFNVRGASKLIDFGPTRDGRTYIFGDGRRVGDANALVIADNRFIEADMATLVDLGLLLLEYTEKGSAKYTITRPGATLGRRAPPDVEQ